MNFGSLQHMQEKTVHWLQAVPAHNVPPTGFGCPLDGLLPILPGRPYFIPTALLGLALRSVPLQGGSRHVSATMDPRVVGSSDISPPQQGPAQTILDFWVLTLPGVPRDTLCVWHRDRRMLPWGSPFPGSSYWSWPDLHPILPHALSGLVKDKARGTSGHRSISTPLHPCRQGRFRTKPPA